MPLTAAVPDRHSSDHSVAKVTHDQPACCAIIGYGNPLRGDDRAGFSVAERLHNSAALPANVTVIAIHQLVPELAELLSRMEQVIFVDAERMTTTATTEEAPKTPPEPPQLTLRSLTPETSPSTSSVDPHRSSPAGLLALAANLYDRAPETAWLVGIPAINFSFGDQFSPITQAGIEQAIDWVIQRLTPCPPAPTFHPDAPQNTAPRTTPPKPETPCTN